MFPLNPDSWKNMDKHLPIFCQVPSKYSLRHNQLNKKLYKIVWRCFLYMFPFSGAWHHLFTTYVVFVRGVFHPRLLIPTVVIPISSLLHATLANTKRIKTFDQRIVKGDVLIFRNPRNPRRNRGAIVPCHHNTLAWTGWMCMLDVAWTIRFPNHLCDLGWWKTGEDGMMCFLLFFCPKWF